MIFVFAEVLIEALKNMKALLNEMRRCARFLYLHRSWEQYF